MKKLILILVLIGSFSFTGCNKDSQVNSFMRDYESVTTQIAENLDEGKIDEARKIFDKEKKDLREKWFVIRGVWSFQVSDGVKKQMKTDPEENMKTVVTSANKAIEKYPTQATKIQAIVNDLSTLLK